VKIALLIGRVILGAIFLYAAWVKLRSPWYMFAAAIDSYQMLPPPIVQFLAHTLPWFELLLGVLLVIGFQLRWIALLSAVILFGFWFSMLRAYGMGLGIDCGCFGPGEKVSPLTLTRDGAMVLLALFLFWFSGRRKQVPEKVYVPAAL
jgi:putative oxidoreductase